jgi:hypothetical protein
MTENIEVPGFTIKSASDDSNNHMRMLLWGMAGCGKTTLAATAPGKKLWLLFDQGGTQSIAHRDDIFVLDLSGERATIVDKFKDDNPFQLEKVLKDHPEIETVVIDSVTSLAVLATEKAIRKVNEQSGKTVADIENPTLAGYGMRNNLVLRAMIAIMRLCRRMERHFIVIAHEDTPEKDDKGVVKFITVALGGKMTNQIGLQLSELWWMSDTGTERRIAVRNCRQRQPMKTRMFITDAKSQPEFVWRYDANKLEGAGINDWYKQWSEAGYSKIPLPS